MITANSKGTIEVVVNSTTQDIIVSFKSNNGKPVKIAMDTEIADSLSDALAEASLKLKPFRGISNVIH
jgi:hypothetical protein